MYCMGAPSNKIPPANIAIRDWERVFTMVIDVERAQLLGSYYYAGVVTGGDPSRY